MSGGRLVVLDRLGREVKRYPLASGLATLGSDPRCDIRVMLPSVSPHHATVVVHTHQTVVRNVGAGETRVNGQAVSVAALRHGDLLTVGDRSLRWEYAEPDARPRRQPDTPLYIRSTNAGSGAPRGARRRGSCGAASSSRDPDVRLALELHHRASMPGNAGGKQVAVVQPQRRDTTEQNEQSPRQSPQGKRQRGAMTQAELWIASRKPAPRHAAHAATGGRASLAAKRSTPLRLAVLRRARSAHKPRVTKIQAPLTIDHTKQAALLLMTGHKGPSPRAQKTPTFLAKKPSPRHTPKGSIRTPKGSIRTPQTPGTATRSSKRGSGSGRKTVSILEISDSTSQQSSIRESSASRRSRTKTSPLLPTPRKSALKDPAAKKSTRKTESIKFDLSNLENHTEGQSEVLTVGETTRATNDSDDEITLHYSDTSSVHSPSPRQSIHSRSSRMLERSLGTSVAGSPGQRSRSSLTAVTPDSPRRKSNRGTLILQKALDTTNDDSRYSRRTTKTLTDHSYDTTVASAFKTRTLSPRSPQNLETYSIVDLVSIDSNESGRSGRSTSVYNSAGSANSSAIAFGTPQNSIGRKTRSTIDPTTLIGSSTPYVKPTRSSSLKSQGSRKSSIKNTSNMSTRSSGSTRRSKSLTTPENSRDTQQHISVNSTKMSRASKSRSRLNDSDLLLISSGDTSQLEDASPRSSRQVDRSTKSVQSPASTRKSSRKSGGDVTPSSNEKDEGTSTPENRHSPEEVGTPVLSIQSLLNSSQSSFTSNNSIKKGRGSLKRKTIGVIRSEPKRRSDVHSKSLNFKARRGLLRMSKDSSVTSDKTDEGAPNTGSTKMVTPKSGVKLVQEAVKNKHSTAKKPQSKRSIIDDLDESDIVKQLFNSPVKRKLSQSMTEFSRKQLFDDDDDIVVARRPTRNTIALTGRTPDNSILDHAEAITPEMFVSPISTPSHSPDLTGIKRLFRKNSPDNDLRNVKGVKGLLRTPRTRRSTRNDLTNISGVKQVFAKSPKNRLSDVRLKEVFAEGPKNDLRRVSGVKSLFRAQKERKSPRNDLSDVRGVKNLFQQKSPKNDLRRVSGVKRALQRGSPRNDLSDVRGVKKLFKGQKQKHNISDVSGIEELFNESNHSVRDSERLFDQLLGKPPIKAVYSKSFIKNPVHKPKTRGRSLHVSLDVITNNVEEWIEQELQKRLHKEDSVPSSKHNMTRELQKLATDTVEGAEPIRTSRVRSSTLGADSSRKKSASDVYGAHTLPIKKRSLVDASFEKSMMSNARGRGLPLKKRVVHSTPVKGGAAPDAAAPRVSPITVADATYQSDSTLTMAEPKANRSKRSTKLAVASPRAVAKSPAKASPKSKTVTKSPKTPAKASPKTKAVPSPRATRGRNTKTDNSPTNTKKRRTSLVISKKSPVMSPKPAPRTRRGKAEPKQASPKVQKKVTKLAQKETPKTPEKPTPKKTRAARMQEVIQATPKRTTRAKVQTATVVVGKPSPQLKPAKSAKVQKEAKPKVSPEAKEIEALKTRAKVPGTRKARKTAASEKTEEETKSKRRKVESPVKPEPAKTRNSRKNAETEPKSKRTKVEVEPKKPEPEKKERRGRKTQVVEEKPDPKRTRKTQEDRKTDTTDSLKPTRARGKKLEPQASVQSEPTTKTRRQKVTEDSLIPETKTRKRKSTSENLIPPKISKPSPKEVETKAKRGRKTTIETTEIEKGNVRQKRSVMKDNQVEISERQKQNGSAVENVRTVRSRKVVVTAVTTTAAAKETNTTRRGKAAPKETETKTITRKNKKTAASPIKPVTPVKSPAPKRTRTARNQPQDAPAATKTTGRTRRR